MNQNHSGRVINAILSLFLFAIQYEFGEIPWSETWIADTVSTVNNLLFHNGLLILFDIGSLRSTERLILPESSGIIEHFEIPYPSPRAAMTGLRKVFPNATVDYTLNGDYLILQRCEFEEFMDIAEFLRAKGYFRQFSSTSLSLKIRRTKKHISWIVIPEPTDESIETLLACHQEVLDEIDPLTLKGTEYDGTLTLMEIRLYLTPLGFPQISPFGEN